MDKVLKELVFAIEARDIANREQLSALDREIERLLKDYGFQDIDAVRRRMELPVQRCVKAHREAMDHLRQLAKEGL
jgi:hypothetical protein